jgi:hypothetical protein
LYIPGETEKDEDVKRTSAQDWENFILARSKEMKKGDYDIYMPVFVIVVSDHSTTVSTSHLLCSGFRGCHPLYCTC